jgi:flagellar protein FliO/FliZ
MAGPGASGGAYGELLVTSLVVLVGVCVLAYVVVRVARRWLGAPRGAAGVLDVIARLPLEPRRSLYIVDVAGKALLVGTSEMGLTVLSELDREQVRARPVVKQTFAEMVQAAWARRKAKRAGTVAPPASMEAVTEADAKSDRSDG